MTGTGSIYKLADTARTTMPGVIDNARLLHSTMPDRDRALAALTMRLMNLPPSGVAAIAADALLRLVEEQNR